MKKSNIIIFGVGIFLFVIGTLLYFSSNNYVKEKQSNNLSQDIQKNNNEKIKKEHCLNSLCIKSMSISVESNINYLTATIINQSEREILSGFINLEFQVGDEKIVEVYYHNELPPNVEISMEIGAIDQKLLKATDYKIKELSQEELEKYNQELHNIVD